jgi:hypothetical protein
MWEDKRNISNVPIIMSLRSYKYTGIETFKIRNKLQSAHCEQKFVLLTLFT